MELSNLVSLKNIMRVAAVSTSVLLTGATATFAHMNVDTTNDTTGQNSSNYTTFSVSDVMTRSRINLATLLSSLGIAADTGNNTIAQNTTVEGAGSGDVEGDFLFVNEVNEMAGLDLGLGGETDIDVDTTNDTTGQNSENYADVDVELSRSVTVINSADLNTNVGLAANTGNNDIRRNTSVNGAANTGDISADITVHNLANNGGSSLGAAFLSGGLGDVSVSTGNHTTGQSSENYAEVDVDSTNTVTETNTANVETNVSLTADSGNNVIRNNTTVSGASTGKVRLTGTIVNSVNNQ